jgi:hypothetical protein
LSNMFCLEMSWSLNLILNWYMLLSFSCLVDVNFYLTLMLLFQFWRLSLRLFYLFMKNLCLLFYLSSHMLLIFCSFMKLFLDLFNQRMSLSD